MNHHVCYEPEIEVAICAMCHGRLHGTGKQFHDPWAKAYGKGLGPVMFSLAVATMSVRAWAEYLKK